MLALQGLGMRSGVTPRGGGQASCSSSRCRPVVAAITGGRRSLQNGYSKHHSGRLSSDSFLCRSEAVESSSTSQVEEVAATPSPATPSPAKPKPKKEKPKDSLEAMRQFSEKYAKTTGTYFCSDPGVTAVVIKGLAEHKDSLGAPLCPCRHYEDKEAEVAQGFWNCPCVPMRERKECHCMLFLTDDNPFRADDATIGYDEINDLTENPEV